MSHKDITIIITTYKSDKIISNCVNSIDENYKILIVENLKILSKINLKTLNVFWLKRILDMQSQTI